MRQSRDFIGIVSDGKLPDSMRKQIAETIRRMEGKKVVVELSEAKKPSSDPQRRYYFAVIMPALQQMFFDAGTTMTKKKMHRWAKQHIGELFEEVVTPDGEITETLRSYMDLSTVEVEVYHTKCRQWAAEYGTDIPEPNEHTTTEGQSYAQ